MNRNIFRLAYPAQLTKSRSKSHSSSSDKPATSKLTKHMFLDKIKSSATDKRQQDDLPVKRKPDSRQGKGAAPAWDSLKDDYMMKSKAVSSFKLFLLIYRPLLTTASGTEELG